MIILSILGVLFTKYLLLCRSKISYFGISFCDWYFLFQLCQREEDTQHTKMMLRFREEKIKQLELLVNGSVTAEKYLMDENIALKEEIQLLQARIDRNPELTRFALENIRLLEQLQL